MAAPCARSRWTANWGASRHGRRWRRRWMQPHSGHDAGTIVVVIDITPQAVSKIRQTLSANHVEGGFRLGVVGGGCSGMSYKFKLEAAPRSTDNIFEYDDVKVFVDPKSYEYLKGLTL